MSKKVCIYLGEVGEDVEAVAGKRGLTASQLLVRAWRIARAEIAALPSSPVPGLRQVREEGPEPEPGAGGQPSKPRAPNLPGDRRGSGSGKEAT